MTRTNELHRPEPLADFLDRGGNPRAELGDLWKFLVEDLSTWVDSGPGHRAEHIEIERAQANAAIAGEVLTFAWGDSFREFRLPETQEELTRAAWCADLLADYGVLSVRLRAFLTPEETGALDDLIWHILHPFPLSLERQYPDPENYSASPSCAACDATFDAGENAMVVGVDDAPNGLRYCYGCVTIVVEAMKAARNA